MPCAYNFSDSCVKHAKYVKVHRLVDWPILDRIGLSFLNVEDRTHVCRDHMVTDRDYQRMVATGVTPVLELMVVTPAGTESSLQMPDNHTRGRSLSYRNSSSQNSPP